MKNELILPKGYLSFRDDARMQKIKLVTNGYSVASPKEIMKMVVRHGDKFPDVRDKNLSSNYGLAFNSKGDAKIIKDCSIIKNLNFETRNYSREGIKISDEEFENISEENLYLTKKEIIGFQDESPFKLNPKSRLDNKIWNFLAEEEEVLKDYINFVFEGVKKRWDRDFAMGIRLDANTNGFYNCAGNVLPVSFNGLGVGADFDINLMYSVKFLGIKTENKEVNDLEKIAFFHAFHDSMKKGEPFLYNENIFTPIPADKISIKEMGK